MIKQKRPRTNRVCIADVAMTLEIEYKERINQIRKIQMDNNTTFKKQRKFIIESMTLLRYLRGNCSQSSINFKNK